MFQNCPNLDDLDALMDWNVSNVNMSRMFTGCYSLTDLDAIWDWYVS